MAVQLFGFAVFVFIVFWAFTVVSAARPDQRYRAANRAVWLLVLIVVPPVAVPLYWLLGSPRTP